MKNTSLDLLYGKKVDAGTFQFDSLVAPPLYSLLPEEVMNECYKIAHSVRLASKIKEKKQMIENLVKPYGLVRAFCGTNRLVFRHLEYPYIMIKIGFDRAGLKDSLKEFKNQQYIKPFCQKVFEVHHSGSTAIVEKVISIRTLYEFMPFAKRIFRMLNECILGKYVLDDIGCKDFYQNYGVRKGFGPVILDFPYMYKLDGKKLICNNKVNGMNCCGIIDYDNTFDNLVCPKCGKRFFARDLDDGSDLDESDGIIRFIKPRKEKENSFICRGEDDMIMNNEKMINPTEEEIKQGFALADDDEMIFDDEPIKKESDAINKMMNSDNYKEYVSNEKEIQDNIENEQQEETIVEESYEEEQEESLASIKTEVTQEVVEKRNKFDDQFKEEYSNTRVGFMVESTFIPDKKEKSKDINPDDLPPIDTSDLLNNKKTEVLEQRGVQIPENLGEVIQNNQIDEEEDYNSMMKQFGINPEDFNEEPIQQVLGEDEKDVVTKEKMYHNKKLSNIY